MVNGYQEITLFKWNRIIIKKSIIEILNIQLLYNILLTGVDIMHVFNAS